MSQSADTAGAGADADEDVDLCWIHFVFHILPPLLMNNTKSI